MSINIRDAIKSLDFFKPLDEEQIALLSSFSILKNVQSDYLLCYEKEQMPSITFLIDGLAKAYKIDKHSNEIFLYYIYKNSLISELSDIELPYILSYSNIIFVEDSQILSINYKEFKKNFIQNNLLSFELLKEVCKRGKKIESLVNREFIFDSVQKVSQMLYSDINMFNKLKRHDISLILHIQPATLSRVLNKLKRNKIIDIIHGKVYVLDKQTLLEMSNE